MNALFSCIGKHYSNSHRIFYFTLLISFLFIFDEILEIVISIINFRIVARDIGVTKKLSVNCERYDLKFISFKIHM